MPELRSGITKYFGNAFILEEDSLRRIQAVLEKAANELPEETEVLFRVEREDDRFYETSNLDDVFSDSNIRGRRIGVIYIILSKSNPIKDPFQRFEVITEIKFTSEEKYQRRFKRRNEIHLEINHENRNWALLLADELEPQIQRTLKSKGFPKWIFLSLLIPIAFILLRIYQKVSPDIAKKVLLTCVFTLLFLLFMGMIISINPPRWYSQSIGPESVFLWGDEVHAYNTRQKLRQNIFWGVVVASIVSFVTGGVLLLF